MIEPAGTTIRRAIVSDAMLLAELGARTFSDTFAADNNPEDMTAYLATSFNPEKQATELADPLCTFLIAEMGGTAVGYAMLRGGGGEALSGVNAENSIELVRFYVSQEWHRCGIGNALMQACVNESRRQDFRTLWLGVWEHNGRAREFYRRWNFRDVGEHIFHLGSDAQNDILMERSL
jgi:ribosomal protein S18 acetylase RimI-like enzyme